MVSWSSALENSLDNNSIMAKQASSNTKGENLFINNWSNIYRTASFLSTDTNAYMVDWSLRRYDDHYCTTRVPQYIQEVSER